MRFWLFLWGSFLLVLGCGSFIADKDGASRQHLKKAEKAFATEQYAEAAAHYAQLVHKQPEKAVFRYKLGVCYLNLQQPDQAKVHLQEAHRLDPQVNKDVVLLIAEAHHLASEYGEAYTYYQQVLKTLPQSEWPFIQFLQKRMQECASGQALEGVSNPVEVLNLGAGINSPYSDYVPVLLPGDTTLLYTTRKPGAKGNAAVKHEQVNKASLVQGNWVLAVPFLHKYKKLADHAVVSVSPSGEALYTYHAGRSGGLFESKKNGEGWRSPVRLGPPFNQGAVELSLHITADNRFVIFSSDRPEGYGGLDLYLCFRQEDGSWSKPLNLGPSVNTPYDEDAPFVDTATNTLYFSSTGHNTIGGYDIFRSVLQEAVWSQAKNLGLPFNSPADDIYFILSGNRRQGYFSSDRPGGVGAKDIYQFRFVD